MPSDVYDSASYDALTGALTRHTFAPALDALIAQTLPDEACAILVIDSDHFKSINDSFGHARGDAILIEIVARIAAALRPNDRLFRFGGDEFVVLLARVTPQSAVHIAERVLDHVRHAPFAGTPPLHMSLSIGVAVFPQDASNATALFEVADQRVYHAKRAGRGRVVAFDLPNLYAEPTAPDRLIERDGVLTAFRAWLTAPSPGSRSFCLHAPDGSGRTRMLSEFARMAAAQGYGVLAVYGDPALRARQFGAALNAFSGWDVPIPTRTTSFVQAFAHAAQRYALGVLILIDDPLGIDPASLDLLRLILSTPEITRLAVVYVDGPTWHQRPPFETPPNQSWTLTPISALGIRVWLRHMLQWEPPDTLVAWVANYSSGLPAWITRAVEKLTLHRALLKDEFAWQWDAHVAAAIPSRPVTPDEILLHLDSLPQLIGRDAETEQLQTWLLSERLVTIVGPGGVGKTRLALQVAAETRSHMRDGVYLVALAGIESPAHIPAAIAQALKLTLPDSGDLKTYVAAFVRTRDLLLVLDNAEHIIDGMHWLPELLHAAPGLRLLVTSRERLALAHEHVLTLEGLALADPQADGTSAAVQLFLQHAQLIKPSFLAQPTDLAQIERICWMLNGLPLGIELAASWVQSYTCAEILEGLTRSLDFLYSTQHDIPARHRRITLVLDSFWALLAPSERLAVQALAVFRSGFTREAAWYVAGASPFLLDGLLAKTFLRRTAQGRFVIHELLRQYAAKRLAQSDADEAAVYDRHSAYYLHMVTEAYTKPDRAANSLDGIGIELDNLRAAWRWAVEQRNVERLATCVHAFGDVMVHLGLTRESLELHHAALALLGDPPATLEQRELAANLEVVCGMHLVYIGRFADALAAVQRAEAHLTGLESSQITARMHVVAGTIQANLADLTKSHWHLKQGLALLVNDERTVVRALIQLAHQLNFAGQGEQANGYAEEAIRRARAAGFERDEARAMTYMGVGYIFQERQHDAIRLFEQVLIPREGGGHAYIDALALANLAQALWDVQAYSRAAVAVEQTLWMARTHDWRHIEGMISRLRGLVMLALADQVQSESAFTSALMIFEQISTHRDRARTHAEYAFALYRRQAYPEALEQIEAGLEVALRYQIPLAAGHALAHRGHILLALDEPDGAAEAYRQAHAYLLHMGRRNRAAEVAAAWAVAELRSGQTTAALERAAAVAEHVSHGQTAFGGMYDPMQMCVQAYDVIGAYNSRAAAALLPHIQALFERIRSGLPLERATEIIAATPSLRQFQTKFAVE